MDEARTDEQRREHDLIARSQQGDRHAFNALVEKYQASAYALALRMTGNAETAADVTQEAFLSAYRAVPSFHGSSFRAWLMRIVSNGCYDVFRARTRHPSSSLDELLESDPDGSPDAHLPAALVDAAQTPEEMAVRGEVVETIQAALLLLPPDQRLALVLSDVQGMTYDEVARIMETPIGTVKSRIARGRAHLRQLLTRGGELSREPARPDSGSS